MQIFRIRNTSSFRLSALYAGVFAVCFSVLLAVTYWNVTAAERNQLRSDVEHELQALTEMAETYGTQAAIGEINERTSIKGGADERYFLSDARGRKIAGDLENIAVGDGWRDLQVADVLPSESESSMDDDHVLWGIGVHLPDGLFLFVAKDAYPILSVQEAIVQSFIWSAAIALLFAAAAGLLIGRGFLRRIDAINRTSQAIIEGRLSERIPVEGSSDEIDRLSINLNRLFDSNHTLLESLKHVSSNIAHDLRTPLSRMRQGLEEAKLKPNSVEVYDEAINAAIAESDRLLAIFSALLRIAQVESGTRKSAFRSVDLSGVFERVAAAYRAVAEDQDKTLNTSIAAGIVYHGDADLLVQMAANILENAIRHTPARTTISLTLDSVDGRPIATVADSGPGIPADRRDKVFDRFYRLEASRTTPGNGLGLAMASAIAALHGIDIALEDNMPGLKVVLDFAADPSP